MYELFSSISNRKVLRNILVGNVICLFNWKLERNDKPQ